MANENSGTQPEIDAIINALPGKNHTEAQLADRYGMSIENIEQVMIDAGYERCGLCDYWVEASETLNDEGDPLYLCKECRE